MCKTMVTDIVGIGDICIQTNVGYIVILNNVRHIVNLLWNLISMSDLDKDNYKHRLSNGIWKLITGSLLVVKDELCCTLFKIQVNLCGC